MTVEEKANLIIKDIKNEKSNDPCKMFRNIVKNEYINIHGPEHHILAGACLLMAFYNAGGKIDIDSALEKILFEGLRMPGAMCELWGICGAITSCGATLAIIDGTGPLSTDGTWGNHMQFTTAAVGELGQINGARCCKRDAMISFKNAVEYVNTNYNVSLEYSSVKCNTAESTSSALREDVRFSSYCSSILVDRFEIYRK